MSLSKFVLIINACKPLNTYSSPRTTIACDLLTRASRRVLLFREPMFDVARTVDGSERVNCVRRVSRLTGVCVFLLYYFCYLVFIFFTSHFIDAIIRCSEPAERDDDNRRLFSDVVLRLVVVVVGCRGRSVEDRRDTALKRRREFCGHRFPPLRRPADRNARRVLGRTDRGAVLQGFAPVFKTFSVWSAIGNH